MFLKCNWQNLRRYGNCDSCHSPSEPVFGARPPNRPVPCCRQPLVNALRPLSRSTDFRGCQKRTIHNAERDASFPFTMPDLRVLCCLRNPCPALPSRRIDYCSPHTALPASVVVFIIIIACHRRQPTGQALLALHSTAPKTWGHARIGKSYLWRMGVLERRPDDAM